LEISVHIFPPNFSDFEDIFEVCPNKFWQNGEKIVKVKVSFQFDDFFSISIRESLLTFLRPFFNFTIFSQFQKKGKFRKFVKVCLHSS